MKIKLRKIHRRIRKCKKCEEILKGNVLPRSGFPPRDIYEAVIIGAEPGPKAKGMMTPTEYEKHFMPGTRNTNRVRLLFEDIKSAGVDYSKFFYTNAVKCPSLSKAISRKCFQNCETYLKEQLTVIKPKFLVVFGSAANLRCIKRAPKDTIERDKYMGIPTIVIRHPQGASKKYRKRVARYIKNNIN
jgi:uracil-DNA glycosylase family 4